MYFPSSSSSSSTIFYSRFTEEEQSFRQALYVFTRRVFSAPRVFLASCLQERAAAVANERNERLLYRDDLAGALKHIVHSAYTHTERVEALLLYVYNHTHTDINFAINIIYIPLLL